MAFQKIKIKSIIYKPFAGIVYDLRVKDDSSYIANKIVVHNCEECKAAMEGNPYPIDQAPAPGTLSCGGRCRHALQIIES